MNWKRAAAASWTLLIIALCSIPGSSLPSPDVAGMDKLAHFGLFLVFGWLWLTVSPNPLRLAVRNVLVAGLILAGLTEIYQGLLPFERDPSVLDAAANTAGLLVGIALWLTMRRVDVESA